MRAQEDRATHYDIWASPEGEAPDLDESGAVRHHVQRYTTCEGVLAEARRLLKAGRSVEIIPVPQDAPPPGGQRRATRSTSRRS